MICNCIGVNGHFVSQLVVAFLTDYFSNKELYNLSYNNSSSDDYLNLIYNKLIENNYDLLKKAYFKAEGALFGQKFESGFSGCTAVTVLVLGNKIICANAGDSRAIVTECLKSQLLGSSVSNN